MDDNRTSLLPMSGGGIFPLEHFMKCYYIKYMEIEFDQDKRNITLRERKLDFAEAAAVFAGPVLIRPDNRHEYGETRFITLGVLDEKIVALVWTPRGEKRHIISMRYANERERKKYKEFLG